VSGFPHFEVSFCLHVHGLSNPFVDCLTIEDEGSMGMGSYIRQLGIWSAPEAGYVSEQIHLKFT
jgi:hypothetical protein